MSHRLTILSLSTIHQDGRVLRQIDFAARAGYHVTVVGWGHLDRARPRVRMTPVPRVILPPARRALQVARMLGGRITPRAFEQWYWAKPDHRQALHAVIASQPDLIHANEAIALPIAMEAARRTRAKVLFDAHEYASEQRADALSWRLLAKPLYAYIIATYATRADAMITVEEHIARRYQEEFGIPQVQVITNAPEYQPFPFRPVNPHRIRLIHHGGAMRERRLEAMIHAIARAEDRFSLEFMLMPGTPGYLDKLQRIAEEKAPGRVTFRPPASPADITTTLHQYDVGVYLLQPANYNQAMALPNKLFEFIMAGLAVAIGPSPAMAAVVQRYGLGVVAESFEPGALAAKLNALTPDDINAMKRASLQAARELNAEREMGKLLDIYARLLAS